MAFVKSTAKNAKSSYAIYKPLLLFLVKAVCIYGVLTLLYMGYVGLADPKGTYDLSPFFGDYNLIVWITEMHVYTSQMVLNLFGYSTNTPDWKTLFITGANGVRVEYACLGVELWIASIALLFAYPIAVAKPLKVKIVGSLVAIGIIFLLNIARIVSIILTNYYNHSMTQTIHDTFNKGVYLLIILGFYLWISKFGQKTAHK